MDLQMMSAQLRPSISERQDVRPRGRSPPVPGGIGAVRDVHKILHAHKGGDAGTVIASARYFAFARPINAHGSRRKHNQHANLLLRGELQSPHGHDGEQQDEEVDGDVDGATRNG